MTGLLAFMETWKHKTYIYVFNHTKVVNVFQFCLQSWSKGVRYASWTFSQACRNPQCAGHCDREGYKWRLQKNSSQDLCLGWNHYNMTPLVSNSLLTGITSGKHWELQVIDLSCKFYMDVVDCGSNLHEVNCFQLLSILPAITWGFRLEKATGQQRILTKKKVSLKPLKSHDQNCFRLGKDDFFQLEGSFNVGQLWLPVLQVCNLAFDFFSLLNISPNTFGNCGCQCSRFPSSLNFLGCHNFDAAWLWETKRGTR